MPRSLARFSRRRRLAVTTGWVAVLLLWAAGGCSRPAAIEQWSGQAMGTSYHIQIAKRPFTLSRSRIVREVSDELRRIERIFSLYQDSSELSRFNAAPDGLWVDVSTDMARVATLALQMHDLTGGVFDPTIAPLVRLWGFQGFQPDWTEPSDAQIQAARAHLGAGQIEVQIDPPRLRKRTPSIELDLNALVEGWGLDRIAARLSELGLRHFLIELGGDLRAEGQLGEGRPWILGIEDPRLDRSLAATVRLTQGALATSGNYRQVTVVAGKRYSHLIDPSTGRPITHDTAAVSVIAPTAFEADAWATALELLGDQRGLPLARSQGIAACFLTRSPTSIRLQLTPAAQGRIRPVRP